MASDAEGESASFPRGKASARAAQQSQLDDPAPGGPAPISGSYFAQLPVTFEAAADAVQKIQIIIKTNEKETETATETAQKNSQTKAGKRQKVQKATKNK